MRFLVTGAAGFVGFHLCDRLLLDGHSVVGVDNFLTGRRDNVTQLLGRPGSAFIQHDVVEPFPFHEDLDGVFHLASLASPADFDDLAFEIIDANVLGTRQLLDLAERKNARFLFAGTSECYGDPDRDEQDEDYWGNVNPTGLRSPYDEAKRIGETITAAYHRLRGVDTRIVRIFNTYGPRMRLSDGRVIPNFITQAMNHEPITIYGDGLQTRSLCYVDDLVEGMIRVMLSPHVQPINLGTPNAISVRGLAEIIKAIIRSRSPIVHRAALTDDPRRRCPVIRRAETLIGWRPVVSLHDGLTRTIEDFRARCERNSADGLGDARAHARATKI